MASHHRKTEHIDVETHVSILLASYRALTGRDLLPPDLQSKGQVQALFDAPFAVVSHDTATDPIFNYGNLFALDLFEMTWEEFTALPSRLSAEPVHRDERARLLEEVSRKGFIDNYKGVRIARSGKRFMIENAVVWNLTDDSGDLAGQAATFSAWTEIP